MVLKDKISIITGAGSGIGRASALLFSKQGATVIVADLNEAMGMETVELIHGQNGQAVFQKINVADASDVKQLMDFTHSQYGKIDILFNNAGIEYFTTIEDTTEEEWDRTMNTNLKGVFLGMKFVLPIMRRQGFGSIINMASAAGLAAWPGLGIYSAAKGGVVLLTKAAAAEYGKFAIRVNCLCPGSIRTPLLEEQFLGKMDDPAAAEAQLLKHYPLKRLGESNEVAGAAVFLAGDSASFVTGQALGVDGGLYAFVGDLIDIEEPFR
jgi:NAD(P)-dependent dehydrogenase (short-subunit alcohol dehydrogenase family)